MSTDLSPEGIWAKSKEISDRWKAKTLKVHKTRSGVIRFSLSVPEILYGNSVHEYHSEDAGRLVALLAELVESMGLDPGHMLEFTLERVDLCRNMLMPSLPSVYVAQFACYPKPPRWSRPVYIPPYQSGFLKNRNHWFGCYDKGKKNRKLAPTSMLRWELQLRSSKEIREILGVSTLQDLVNLSEDTVRQSMLRDFATITSSRTKRSCASTDVEAIWAMALAKGERRAGPAFVIDFLLRVGEFDPIALTMMRDFLRTTLGLNFRNLNETYLRTCPAGSFDGKFIEDVLIRF